jgi:hypothetical protein
VSATALHSTGTEVDLLGLTGAALDELYRRAPAGPLPRGTGMGTAILLPGRRADRWLARFVRMSAWQGKVFDDDGRHLVNRLTPLRRRAIRASVYEDASWLDGRPSLFIDYSKTSRVARWVHDEIREIGPGRYLGLVYLRRRRLPVRFVLEFSAH